MNCNRRIAAYIGLILFGLALIVLGSLEMIDTYWSGMGGGLMGVSIIWLVRLIRMKKNAEYREAFEVEMDDERNRFLRAKAWAWAGYLFIIIAGVLGIVLKVLGQDQLSLAASLAVCLMLLLYLGAYMIARKKY